MTLKCNNCGMPIANGQVGPCPRCGSNEIGATIDAYQNYSGSVSVLSSNASTYEALSYAKSLLESIMASDPERAGFVKPVVEKLYETAQVVKKQEAIFATSRKPDWEIYAKKLAEYKKLVDAYAEEPDFQEFFKNNAHFLDPKFKTAYPKYTLAGELVPDFLLVLYDSSYLFVEIEKPSVRLFNQQGNPTADFTQAQQQIRTQLKWVSDNKAFLKDRECKNLTGDNFRGLLVVGRSADLKPEELRKLENINAEVRGKYEIKTFDAIFDENFTILENIRKTII